MSKKRNDIILEKVNVEELAAEGKGLSRVEGKVIFSEFTAPGDVVDLKVYKSKKNFAEAEVLKFHERSADRSEPFCSHYGTCGGCKLQHIDYEVQLFYKAKQVKDNLERIGKVKLPAIKPILGAAKQQYYRNKLEYTFSDRRWLTLEEVRSEGVHNKDALGFHMPGVFDKVIDIHHCYLQPDPSNAIRLAIKAFAQEQKWAFFNLRNQYGFLRSLMIRTSTTGDLMVLVQFFEKEQEKINALMDFLSTKFPEISSLNYVVNKKGNDTIFDQEVITYHGKPYIEERMEGLTFRIGAKSFYQTNSEQAYELYKITRALAGLTGSEVVYDLYTGTGTIANFVAGQAKKVVGVEQVAMAIEDAKINAQVNGLDNTSFYAGDMKDVFTEEFIRANGKPDVIITDPPRAGMHEDVIRTLLNIAAPRIVYVSCNPATQARDLSLLDELYEVKEVQPVDMFPHTHHVENVVLLEKR
ncbi:MAG TPA: 23S rRNA (uracil(1939)-C(5))-methyltransferase RlmD [Cytophagaceae bacterium]|nr:23S rRNA (uracil(1939)-C(5))-methyltransferase RlmD [Cytophagaceae bacterium]